MSFLPLEVIQSNKTKDALYHGSCCPHCSSTATVDENPPDVTQGNAAMFTDKVMHSGQFSHVRRLPP